MPRIRKEVDPRTVILRTAEARQGFRSHAETARNTGMKTATLQKRFRLPGTMTLDELRAVVGGVLTADEALELIEGRKRR